MIKFSQMVCNYIILIFKKALKQISVYLISFWAKIPKET